VYYRFVLLCEFVQENDRQNKQNSISNKKIGRITHIFYYMILFYKSSHNKKNVVLLNNNQKKKFILRPLLLKYIPFFIINQILKAERKNIAQY